MRFSHLILPLFLLSGCAGAGSFLGAHQLTVPPEFNQKIKLLVDDRYQMHQAPMSTYDVGDLESFHIQHTLPVVVEGAFKEMFGKVEMVGKGPDIQGTNPDVPAIFEVRLIDAANDNYSQAADDYNGEVTLAVAMKSPRDQIFWQKTFLGKGYAQGADPYSMKLGPQNALLDALHNAVEQMQDAIIASPEVKLQLRHYLEIDALRRKREIKISKSENEKKSL